MRLKRREEKGGMRGRCRKEEERVDRRDKTVR